MSKESFDSIYKEGKVDYSFGTAGQKSDSAINNFQRIPLEMSNLTASEILNSELFYYIAKEMLGKNKIIRR